MKSKGKAADALYKIAVIAVIEVEEIAVTIGWMRDYKRLLHDETWRF